MLALLFAGGAYAQTDEPAAVLELRFTPAARAQIAVWLEDAEGRFLRTVALTEAVAYRGLGNRPGASQMNSGYRWPYGRREGVLPIWASRRAAAPGAQPFRRVIFQDRQSEGLASRTSSDQSIDDYYCLSFDRSTTSREALDAVSCASVFASDKGRFITQSDVDAGYGEPWEDPASGVGRVVPLALHSLYPPRMDVTQCDGSCFDHPDVTQLATHAREVMPEIDAVTMATPPGEIEQSLLFSLPAGWPAGQYVAWLEINVEGDYNDTFNAESYPTPTQPASGWDSWSMNYGYPYRGQPSIAFRVPFELAEVGEQVEQASAPIGRSSWDMWSDDYGALLGMSGVNDDPTDAPGSGADRLRRDPDGARLTLLATTLSPLSQAEPGEDPFDELPAIDSSAAESPEASQPQDGEPGAEASEQEPAQAEDVRTRDPELEMGLPEGDGVVVSMPAEGNTGPVGAIEELRLRRHEDVMHSHEWIGISFRAARSEQPLHRYEVRVGTQPIVDEPSFVRNARPAKTATTDAEGAVMLMLPTDVAPGELVRGEIGNLTASTEHYVAVRAVDRLNRRGAISVARITTTERTFATVSACVIATAAYGSPLAGEVGSLRRLRDRYLMSHAPGRALVAAYYAHGPALAAQVRRSPLLRALVLGALDPLVSLARWLDA